MKKLITLTLMVFTLTAFNVAPVYAGGHTGGSKCSGCAYQEKQCKVKKLKKKMTMFWAYKDELKLSDGQLDKIGEIKHVAMKQMIRETAEVKAIKVDVKTEMWEPQIDVNKVNPLIDAKYAAKAQLAKTMVKALADAQSVLNKEQREKLKDIKSDRYIEKSGILGSKCTGKYCPLAKKS